MFTDVDQIWKDFEEIHLENEKNYIELLLIFNYKF